jgi:hypothetical protein
MSPSMVLSGVTNLRIWASMRKESYNHMISMKKSLMRKEKKRKKLRCLRLSTQILVRLTRHQRMTWMTLTPI